MDLKPRDTLEKIGIKKHEQWSRNKHLPFCLWPICDYNTSKNTQKPANR